MPDPKVPGEADSSQETESEEIMSEREERQAKESGTGEQSDNTGGDDDDSEGGAASSDEEDKKDDEEEDEKEEEESTTWLKIKILDAKGEALSDDESCKLKLPGVDEKTVGAKKGLHEEKDIEKTESEEKPVVKLADRYDYEWDFVEVVDDSSNDGADGTDEAEGDDAEGI